MNMVSSVSVGVIFAKKIVHISVATIVIKEAFLVSVQLCNWLNMAKNCVQVLHFIVIIDASKCKITAWYVNFFLLCGT